MIWRTWVIFISLLFIYFCKGDKVLYTNYKVFRIVPKTQKEFKNIQELEDLSGVVGHTFLITFWLGPSPVGQPSDIMIPPHMHGDLLDNLRKSGMDLRETVQNVQELIDNEASQILFQDRQGQQTGEGSSLSNKYLKYNEVQQFLKDQAAAHPETVKVIVIGKSYEGRDLSVIKVSSGSGRPAIWIDSNIHAREWITGAVSINIINEILNGQDPELKAWLEDFDFYILPVLNPDGLEYTKKERLWRKSRSKTSTSTCLGTDLNRNWGFQWMNGGSSPNACSPGYAGPKAFSEPETIAVSKFMMSLKGTLQSVISLHCHGQYILIPFGTNTTLDNYDEYMRISKAIAKGISKRYGTTFVPGSVFNLMGIASGGLPDWVVHELGVKYTTAIELRDKGKYGFILPPDQILPSTLEIIDGLKALVNELRTQNGQRGSKDSTDVRNYSTDETDYGPGWTGSGGTESEPSPPVDNQEEGQGQEEGNPEEEREGVPPSGQSSSSMGFSETKSGKSINVKVRIEIGKN